MQPAIRFADPADAAEFERNPATGFGCGHGAIGILAGRKAQLSVGGDADENQQLRVAAAREVGSGSPQRV